jgi:hypothetical protein
MPSCRGPGARFDVLDRLCFVTPFAELLKNRPARLAREPCAALMDVGYVRGFWPDRHRACYYLIVEDSVDDLPFS